MLLIDTNIFLEILLGQKKKDICKNFLNKNINNLCISDFSLHSIGVILFRENKHDTFKEFCNDFVGILEIITLPNSEYTRLIEANEKFKLDFDDAYQYTLSEFFDLEIITMDKDFNRIKKGKIRFL